MVMPNNLKLQRHPYLQQCLYLETDLGIKIIIVKTIYTGNLNNKNTWNLQTGLPELNVQTA